MTSNTGKNIDDPARIDVDAQLFCADIYGSIDCQGKRRPTQFNGTDAQHQVMHDGVAHQCYADDITRRDIGFAADL